MEVFVETILGSDNLINITGLKETDGTPVTTATVTATLYDNSGLIEIPGTDIVFENKGSGDYTGVLDSKVQINKNTYYKLLVDIVDGIITQDLTVNMYFREPPIIGTVKSGIDNTVTLVDFVTQAGTHAGAYPYILLDVLYADSLNSVVGIPLPNIFRASGSDYIATIPSSANIVAGNNYILKIKGYNDKYDMLWENYQVIANPADDIIQDPIEDPVDPIGILPPEVAATVFEWLPSRNPTRRMAPKINSINFGDGYSQISPKGINNIAQEWTLEFKNRDLVEINNIENYLKDKHGFISFPWVNPLDKNSINVKCDNWTKTTIVMVSETKGYGSLRATFKQTHD